MNNQIIDDLVFKNAKAPRAAKPFDGYAVKVFIPHHESYARKYPRVYVVSGIYHQDSLKNEVQQKRGTRVR